jgi:hypothetical protein
MELKWKKIDTNSTDKDKAHNLAMFEILLHFIIEKSSQGVSFELEARGLCHYMLMSMYPDNLSDKRFKDIIELKSEKVYEIMGEASLLSGEYGEA